MYKLYGAILVYVILLASVSTMKSTKEMEGYPAGYLSDCPGNNIDVPLLQQLKYLTISVQRKQNFFGAKPAYNYYRIKELAKDPGVDFTKPTVLWVGGYLDHPGLPHDRAIGTLYKKLGYTVLLLNTNRFTTVDYSLATRNMRTIGKHTAEMLATLTNYGLNPKRLQLVGVSLGGHTISFIAKNYRLLTGMNISRVTALDPAGPCFRNLGPEDRLDQTDADFVDVIDTNIDGYGMAAPVGHVNFYVNGGEYQPGDIIWAPCGVFCSHIRAALIWMAALQYPTDGFIAIKCNSVQEARNKLCYDNKPMETNILGLNTDKTKPGIYFLATQNNFPYFMGVKGLKKDNEFFNLKVNLNIRKSLYEIVI